MEVTGHPFEITPDVFGADNIVDLIDGHGACIPERSSALLAELFYDFVQTQISHHREMRSCVARVRAGATLPLDQRDLSACFLQQIRGRNSRQSTAHDGDIDV